MNIKHCLQSVFFASLLVSVGAYADTTTEGTSSKGGGTKMQTTTTSDEGFSNKGNNGQGNVKSMHTSSEDGKGYHYKQHKQKGWHHGKDYYYHGISYDEPYFGGGYKHCKKVKGHYNRFGDWIPKHKVCFERY